MVVGLQTNAQDLLFRHEFSSFRFLQACFRKLHASSLTKPGVLTTPIGVSATSHFSTCASVEKYTPVREARQHNFYRFLSMKSVFSRKVAICRVFPLKGGQKERKLCASCTIFNLFHLLFSILFDHLLKLFLTSRDSYKYSHNNFDCRGYNAA